MPIGRIAHVTLGKAGSQWIKDVLTDPDIFSAQNFRFFQPRGGAYQISDFAREPDGTFSAPIFQVNYLDWKTYAKKGDRAIAVLRDPRDSIVSWAFSVAYSHVTEDHIELVRPAMLALDLRGKLEMAAYTYWESSMDQRSWAGRPNTASERVYRYEEIIADQFAAFRSIVDFFQWDVADAALRGVIDRLSFATRSGRAPGQKDEFSHYRNAVAGDWKNYFDRDFARRFETACAGLLVALGYETANDWWEGVPQRCEMLERDALAHREATALGASQREFALMQKELDALRSARMTQRRMLEEIRRLARDPDGAMSRRVPSR